MTTKTAKDWTDELISIKSDRYNQWSVFVAGCRLYAEVDDKDHAERLADIARNKIEDVIKRAMYAAFIEGTED